MGKRQKPKRSKSFTGYPSEKTHGQGPSQPVKPVTADFGQAAHAPSLDSARTEAPRLRRSGNGKFLIPVAVGALGGAAYAAHRRHNVNKILVEPISGDEFVFSKAGRLNAVTEAASRGLDRGRRGAASARRNRGKIGLAAGGATVYGAGRATGGFDTRQRARNTMGREKYNSGAPDESNGAAFGAWEDKMGDRFSADKRRDRQRYRAGGRVAKAGYGGAGLPDRVHGPSTPMIGQTRSVGALVPTGKHVSQANNFERFTPLKGYRRTPSGAASQRFLHVRGKGRDKASSDFKGVSKGDGFVPRLDLRDVDRLGTYGRQAGRHGRRIA